MLPRKDSQSRLMFPRKDSQSRLMLPLNAEEEWYGKICFTTDVFKVTLCF
jgi:hypothetical protein